MPFESFNDPQKPEAESTPDILSELVRRTQDYLKQYPSESHKSAAGLAIRDYFGGDTTQTGERQERADYLKAILAQLAQDNAPEKPNQPTQKSRKRYGYGNRGADARIAKGDE